jgi:class 3 adenylate cyclase/tetratricopeptide (TPR) repeat protein
MPPCTNCHRESPEGFAFCGHCGAPLTPAATSAEVRKRISVVFCDLVGSTPLGERLDPESFRRVMTRYYDTMRTVLERHDGSVGKFEGDAIMALFGVPKLHEDDALRAVRAAGEMSNTMAALNQELEREWGVQLACRIGVNTGYVLTGDDLSAQHLVVGDALNTAARLEQAAGAGEVLLSEATYALVQHAVDVEEVPPLPLRGKTGDVRAFRLLNVNPEAPAQASRRDSPLVGRDAELARLWDEFESTLARGSCRLLTVVGPAGIGKTRLVDEFTASVGARASVLRGRCLSYGRGVTFWAVTEVIKQGADISPGDNEDQARRKLLAVLADQPEARRICDGVADVIGLSTTRAAPAEAFWSLRKFLEAKARRHPVVVFLEDLHWAESTFLDFVEHVVRSSRGVPLLILATARPELLGDRLDWATSPTGSAVLLPPLSESASMALLEDLAADGLDAAARAQILEAAEGNPFFLEQMLLMLRDDESLKRIPPTVQAVLAARLDRLAPPERRFLEAAAVEGKEFEIEAVGTLLREKTATDLARDVAELLKKELIEPGGAMASQGAFRFRHILIRDVAYDSIPKQTRSDLHARLADWMDQADGSPEHEAIVGHHLEQAYRYLAELRPVDHAARNLAARAANKLAKAGRGTLARGDAPAASNLLGRASVLLPPTDPLRPGLLVSLAASRRGEGDLDGAASTLDEVLRGPTVKDDPRSYANALLERGWLRLSMDPTGWATEALNAAKEAVTVFEPIGDDRGLARAYQLKTEVHFSNGQLSQCRADTQMALQYARRSGDVEAETNARMYLGGPINYGDGTVQEMLELAEDNLRWAERIPVAWVLRATASHAYGRAYAMLGKFDESRKVAKREQATLEDLGQVGILAWTRSHVSAFIETLAGDHTAAEAELRESYRLLEGYGAKNTVGAAARLAHTLCALRRYQEAERFAVVTRDAMPGDVQEQALWRSALAKVLAQRGNISEAERLARQATQLLEPTGFINQCGDAELDLAEVLVAAGRPDQAAIALERALDLYRRKGNTVSAAWAEEHLARLRVGTKAG